MISEVEQLQREFKENLEKLRKESKQFVWKDELKRNLGEIGSQIKGNKNKLLSWIIRFGNIQEIVKFQV